MKRKRWYLPTLGLLALVLAALACSPGGLLGGGDGGDAGGEVGPDAAPVGEGGPEGAAPGGDDNVPAAYNPVDPNTLSSYRTQFEMTFVGTDENGAPVDVRMTINEARTSNPPASQFSMEGEGTDMPDTGGIMQFVQIGDTGYMLVDEGGQSECVAMSDSEPFIGGAPFSPDMVLSGQDVSGAKRILPNEQVNGVMTRHYRFTENDLALAASGLTNYEVDFWVAVDGGYVVRSVLSADGTQAGFEGSQGHLEWTYDLLDINVPFSIEIPAGCEEPASSDLPMLADAVDVTSFGGTVSYTTPSSIDDAVAFYSQQMPAQGWTPGPASTDIPGFATLEFTRDGETASIIISEGDGGNSVLISVE